MAEPKLPTSPSSSGLVIRPVELAVTLLVLVTLARAVSLWFGMFLNKFVHRFVSALGGPLHAGF